MESPITQLEQAAQQIQTILDNIDMKCLTDDEVARVENALYSLSEEVGEFVDANIEIRMGEADSE